MEEEQDSPQSLCADGWTRNATHIGSMLQASPIHICSSFFSDPNHSAQSARCSSSLARSALATRFSGLSSSSPVLSVAVVPAAFAVAADTGHFFPLFKKKLFCVLAAKVSERRRLVATEEEEEEEKIGRCFFLGGGREGERREVTRTHVGREQVATKKQPKI